MDLHTYEIFITLAATRHFGRTAQACNLSASAVSRHLQRLERSVGQQLVNRDNRQVYLTPAGAIFWSMPGKRWMLGCSCEAN
ncbi:MAG: LysR family positive regulator for ilvC [Gammaproteobacteria bacterium]|jgi:LysR family positive regulator for ilvC